MLEYMLENNTEEQYMQTIKYTQPHQTIRPPKNVHFIMVHLHSIREEREKKTL